MNPTPRPAVESVVPPQVMVPLLPQTSSPNPAPMLQAEDVRAEVEAELDDTKKCNFYAWWLACEGYGSIF
jgi:hypothetical protein